MNCTCGCKLQFTDNSLKTENGKTGEVRAVYYCDSCNIAYDGYELDCEGKYVKLPKRYLKWFDRNYMNGILNKYCRNKRVNL